MAIALSITVVDSCLQGWGYLCSDAAHAVSTLQWYKYFHHFVHFFSVVLIAPACKSFHHLIFLCQAVCLPPASFFCFGYCLPYPSNSLSMSLQLTYVSSSSCVSSTTWSSGCVSVYGIYIHFYYTQIMISFWS